LPSTLRGNMDIFEAIEKRRSIRNYQDRDVEEEKIIKILEAARAAPSASNRQEWRFIVVRDKEVRKKLCKAAKGQKFVQEAPVVIACCAETDNHTMSCGQLCYPIDVAISIDHMTLAAVQLGLGTCWVGAFYEEQVKKVIDLGPQTNQGLEETRRLQKELNDEIKKAEEERDAEREKGILGNKVLINQLEGRISGYKNIKKELSDLGYINEEDAREAEAAKKAQFKSDSEAIKRKEAEIKDELKRIKSIRDARVREAEERAKLERDAAQTVEERAQVEINLINSIRTRKMEKKENL